jgi:hypothetical protein
MLPVLRPYYQIAIDKLASLPRTRLERARDPTARLAEHVAAFCWRGEESLQGAHSLVISFYTNAPPWLRAHLADFIGRSLRNTEDAVPEPVQERLMKLWDWRLEVLSQASVDDLDRKELESFMWWVTSAKLPSHWTASRLVTVSQLIPSPGHELMFALERMVALADDHPLEIAVAIENLIQKDKDLWHTSAWADNIVEAMRRLIATGEKDAERSVRRTAEVLGRRGFLQFREFAKA